MPPPYHNQFPSDDPGPVRLALIGEALGTTEVARGLPFQGAAGQQLDRQLAKVGLLRSRVFVGNVAAVQPFKNEFDSLDWSGPEVQDGIAALLADLAAFRPNLILTMGNVPLHLFAIGNVAPLRRKRGSSCVYVWPRKVTEWRGSLFEASNRCVTTLQYGIDNTFSPLVGFNRPATHNEAGDSSACLGRVSSNEAGSRERPASLCLRQPAGTEADPTVDGVRPDQAHEKWVAPKPVESRSLADLTVSLHSAVEGQPTEPERSLGQSERQPAGDLSGEPANAGGLIADQPLPVKPCAIADSSVWKCLATVHPAFCLRSWGEWFNFQHDLRRAVAEATTANLNLPEMDFDYGPR